MAEKKNQEFSDSSDSSQDHAYLYRWDYREQARFDETVKKQQKRNGALIYAFVMTAVFLLCFALLVGMLVWYGTGEHGSGIVPETGMSTVGAVAENVKPATVLIYAANSNSYAYGTGFFIRSNGYIATNYHVVEDASYITVTLYSGEEYEAELVGYRKNEDLAVLKIRGNHFPVLEIGDSDALYVGDTVVAVGNPSGPDAAWTTTTGIVSALDRAVITTFEHSVLEVRMIQTDASLNPGNSGGPLCNLRGEVIGVVTSKLIDNEGISFALPISGAIEILDAIVEKGTAEDVESTFSRERPLIGITCAAIRKGETYTYDGEQYVAEYNGVMIMSVEESSGAYGKLFIGDIVVALDGKAVEDLDGLTELLYLYKVGDAVDFQVCRDGKLITVKASLTNS